MTSSFHEAVGRIGNFRQQRRRLSRNTENKKANVVKHSKAFDHVGLLFNEPPGTAELLFI
jgi:hypothetical protein